MATDPRRLRPGELCRLLNSTPLGEVITDGRLQRQRSRAGLRIGDGHRVDLVRYVAWLVQSRHAPRTKTDPAATRDLSAAALGAAALGCRKHPPKGHGQKLLAKQEALIAALLTEPSYAAAAAKAGISEATVYRWLNISTFRAAYRQACRELVEATIGRIQAATGHAVDALVIVATTARRDSDRVRASVAILQHAYQGLANADSLHGDLEPVDDSAMNTNDVVRVLAKKLRQVERSELSTTEKVRLTSQLADSLLRAIQGDAITERLESLQAILAARKEREKKKEND